MKLIQIHQDERGKINLIEGLLKENKEVTIFETKKGYARGGCVHNENHEYFCVIEGSVKIYVGEEVTTLLPGASIVIPKNTPHYFVALEDCIIMEWGATAEEKKEKDKERRKIVERINSGRKSNKTK